MTGILFRVSAENLARAGRDPDTEKLAEAISRNLGAWGYPVTADAEADCSHVMEPKESQRGGG